MSKLRTEGYASEDRRPGEDLSHYLSRRELEARVRQPKFIFWDRGYWNDHEKKPERFADDVAEARLGSFNIWHGEDAEDAVSDYFDQHAVSDHEFYNGSRDLYVLEVATGKVFLVTAYAEVSVTYSACDAEEIKLP